MKGKANCTCEASRLSADHVCVHTRLVQHHRAQLPQLLPGQDAAHVTRIGPQKLLQSSKSAPWYWVSNDSVGAFVQQLDPTRFRCSHASHSSKCVDIQHVESYLSGISSSPFLAASNSSISSEDTAPVDTDDEVACYATNVSYTYPETQQQAAIMHNLLRNGPPSCMRPELPSAACQCGLAYKVEGYVTVTPHCTLYQDAPQYAQTIELQVIGTD